MNTRENLERIFAAAGGNGPHQFEQPEEYTSGTADNDTAEGWLDDPDFVGVATAHRWIDDHDQSWDEFIRDNPTAVVIGRGIMSDTIFKWLGY